MSFCLLTSAVLVTGTLLGVPNGGAALRAAGSSASCPTVHRPVATYSIVARDPDTGELGVAVQSHWFSVGSVVS